MDRRVTPPKRVTSPTWGPPGAKNRYLISQRSNQNWTVLMNRPFYRYGGHIELIRFKEYYRMPRGHEHISFVFSSAFRDIFS